jgi:hypothetical protein
MAMIIQCPTATITRGEDITIITTHINTKRRKTKTRRRARCSSS